MQIKLTNILLFSFPNFSDLLYSIPCHKNVFTYLDFTIIDVASKILIIQNKLNANTNQKCPYICCTAFAKELGKSPGWQS